MKHKISITAIALVAIAVLLIQLKQNAGTASKYAVDSSFARLSELRDDKMNWVAFSTRPKVLTLTFDDGPSDPVTDRKILKILDKHSAKSIWFVNCKNFIDQGTQNENRQVLSEIRLKGHVIANHGFNHVDLIKLDKENPDKVTEEVKRCNELIEDVVGVRPKYFRPPWGKYNARIKEIIDSEKMQLVLWLARANSFDYLFHKHPEKYKNFLLTEYRLEEKLESGDIILLHDYSHTAEILDDLLTRLERKGFQFVLPFEPYL